MGMMALAWLTLLLVARKTQGFNITPTSRSTTLIASSSTALFGERYNPLSTMLGNLAGAVVGGGGGSSAPSDPDLDSTLKELTGTSWSGVRNQLESKQTTEEKEFRQNVVKGYGPASPLNKIRLYDESNKEEDIRVTFFRDSASWCPYCQKVWMSLEEKKVPYKIEKVNMRCYGEKTSEFSRMQPSGQIPVAVIDGKVYGQSNDILYALEQLFPEHKSLMPRKGLENQGQELLRLERTLFSAWMMWLTGDREPERFKANFINVLSEVESVLAMDGPFFMGKDVTTVDFQFCPFLERMAASLLFFKGFMMRVPPGSPTDFPAINKWFDAMETLDSYKLTKSDYYTHCWDLPPQLGGCSFEEAGEPYEKSINGERSLDKSQGSWELPLQPHNGGVEPDWEWAGDEQAARREATERLAENHAAIIKFAARGAGRKGMPPYSAPLADPNAVPNEAVQSGVESCLQLVSLALLDGTQQHEETMSKMANAIVKDGGAAYAKSVSDSLAYLRDRVGVPRDMRLPAARQLRAHLNWAIGKILAA